MNLNHVSDDALIDRLKALHEKISTSGSYSVGEVREYNLIFQELEKRDFRILIMQTVIVEKAGAIKPNDMN